MSPNVQVSAQSVRQLIEDDTRTAEALATLLQEEHQLLQQREHTRLTEILGNKQAHMAKLEHNAQQRGKWVKFLMERTQLSREACWERLLNELQDPELPALWQTFQDKVDACKALNDTNGKLIARGQRTLKQLLGIMRGQTVAPAKLYTASGDTHTANASHTVVKA